MEESDNSVEGMGQVLQSIQQQTGLNAEEFLGHLPPKDGHLEYCQNFNSLRALRVPNKECHENLNNVLFQLGASHTMWNITQNIYVAHFGDHRKCTDLGVWHSFLALEIPPEKNSQYIEKVHEATFFYCLR